MRPLYSALIAGVVACAATPAKAEEQELSDVAASNAKPLRGGPVAARAPRKFTVADFNDDAAEPVQGGGFLAQLLAEVEFRVDERNLKAMGPDALAKIKQRMVAEGWAQIEAGKRYVRRTPLIGRVEVGKRKFFTDQKGFVQFRAMPPAKDLKDVPFFRQISDTRPFVVIPRLELAPAGQTPKPSLATLVTGLPP